MPNVREIANLMTLTVTLPECLRIVTDVKVKTGKDKKGQQYTKFKLRLSKYLYTLKVTDNSKATKINESFPPGSCCFAINCLTIHVACATGLKKEELKK